MSLNCVVFGRAASQDGYLLQAPSLPWNTTASLTSGQTLALKRGQIVQLTAATADATFDCGGSTSQTLLSGTSVTYSVSTDCTLTVA